ncbi:MAG: hypothetical protein OSB07_00450 [Dehalococcoidia bacterium]|nr:hypothetical protein [Dehalococcoidia bacterium]
MANSSKTSVVEIDGATISTWGPGHDHWHQAISDRYLLVEIKTPRAVVVHSGKGTQYLIKLHGVLSNAVSDLAISRGVASDRITTVNQATDKYIDLMKKIPEVIEVHLADDEEGQSLWTVISATPFENEPRDRVFSAQIEIMRMMDKPLLEFHLTNIQEMPGGSINGGVQSIGTVLWSAY